MPRKARPTPANLSLCPICFGTRMITAGAVRLGCPRCAAICSRCRKDGAMPPCPGILIAGIEAGTNAVVRAYRCRTHLVPFISWSPIPTWLADPATSGLGRIYLVVQDDAVVVTCLGLGAALNWRELARDAQTAVAADGETLGANREAGFAVCPAPIAARAILTPFPRPAQLWNHPLLNLPRIVVGEHGS